jgi:hypothetical protein
VVPSLLSRNRKNTMSNVAASTPKG